MSKILYETDGAIATIRLNRPEKLHALDEEMLHGLADGVAEIDASTQIRVVLLGATGNAPFPSAPIFSPGVRLSRSKCGGAGSAMAIASSTKSPVFVSR